MKIGIRTKLTGSFLLVVLLTAVIGVLGIKLGSDSKANVDLVANNRMPIQLALNDVEVLFSKIRQDEVQMILTVNSNDQKEYKKYLDRYQKDKKELDKLSQILSAKLTSDFARKKFAVFAAEWKRYEEIHKKIVSYVDQGNMLVAIAIFKAESRDSYIFAVTALDELRNHYEKETGEIVRNIDARYHSSSLGIMIIMAAALAISIATALYVSGSISKSVELIAKTADRVGNGDLTVDIIEFKSEDEIGTLADSFNKMVDNVKKLIHQISAASQAVAATGEELSSKSEEAARATQQVAAAIQQIAAGSGEQFRSTADTLKVVEQVALAVDQIASGAQEQSSHVVAATDMVSEMANKIDAMAKGMEAVRKVSEQNGVIATNGGQVVEKTVNGMLQVKNAVFETARRIHELGEQSQKIGEIIQVIDGIAEQTNLLALNAAIEAARAGEHGKGFAVVADEVRKLAERSGKATKEIAELITNIQHDTGIAVESMHEGTREVEEGLNLAQEAGRSLNEIVEGVKTAGDSVRDIMGLINDILTGSQEVFRVVNNVAAITEENTAATEQISASAQQVNSSMQNIASISQENAAASEEVSASTQKLTDSVEAISSSSEQLAKMAQELHDMVFQFKV